MQHVRHASRPVRRMVPVYIPGAFRAQRQDMRNRRIQVARQLPEARVVFFDREDIQFLVLYEKMQRLKDQGSRNGRASRV